MLVNQKISETQAVDIAKNALGKENPKKVRAIISDHIKYGKVWEIDFILQESFNEATGKTFLINMENGDILEVSNLGIIAN